MKMLKKVSGVVFVSLLFLSGCVEKKAPPPEKTWQEEVAALDREIDRLIDKSEEYRTHSNEEERKAILYMRSDWPKYSKMMQQVEKDQDFSSDMDKYIQELKARRQKIIDAHKTDPTH